MAEATVFYCDFAEGGCGKVGARYILWRDGDRQAWQVDLCDDHARPLTAIMGSASQVELPSKPRVKMTATRLRTTPATRHLKK